MSPPRGPPSAIDFFDMAAPKYEWASGSSTREVGQLVLQLPQLQDLQGPAAVVLDNACGTAVVAEEIIAQCKRTGAPLPQIHAVDPAKKMLAIAQDKIAALGAQAGCKLAVMPAEKLDFPDATFTHSITNLGILFFADAPAAAKEIYRTLKPGGVAVVTSWSDMGYVKGVIQPAQKAARPDDKPFNLPIPPEWFSADHVKAVLEDGGFAQVQLVRKPAHFGAPALPELRDMLLEAFIHLWSRTWSEDEQVKFKEAVLEHLAKVTVPYTTPSGEPGVGVPMEAIIAVCRK
ncbi:uncharacterized protein UV8b_00611 [Ustilaginoidea virens]|uniref:Methyltransferase domain-containing protein n=1 Tax=Ustilaginoidea virens TaxID=1159556 RepID=A0A8E5HJ35_USTVR|nr:uncharacterized protein UV8b_00611 [Ustilaginoidea virens]QUC16370.1 hypothetical protein UV8b_00611 [Ustilaginoidea virens]